jgi:hypothetical protein
VTRSYLIDSYLKRITLAQERLSALPAGDEGIEELEVVIWDMEARLAWARANDY